MANIVLDYSNSSIFNNGDDSFRQYTYKDIGTNNIKIYDNKKLYDINTSCTDENAIKNSLRNIFIFRPGQSILQPQFGNTIYNYLYQPMMEMTANKIIRTIKQMIRKWQPRISILEIPIQMDQENNTYYIQLKYNIPTINKTSSTTIAINKNETIVQ